MAVWDNKSGQFECGASLEGHENEVMMVVMMMADGGGGGDDDGDGGDEVGWNDDDDVGTGIIFIIKLNQDSYDEADDFDHHSCKR